MTAGDKEAFGGLASRCFPTDFLGAPPCLKFRNSTSIRVGALGDREEAISFGSQMPNGVPPPPSCRLCHQLEYSNMKTGKTSLLGRLSGVFWIALVALAFSIGGSYVVRAEQPE